MDEQNPFEQIQKFFKEFHGEINIIDEQIDIKLQMEYFEMSKNLKDKPLEVDWEDECELLYNLHSDNNTKKEMLVRLAALDNVKAYRCIEKFSKEVDETLRHWSLLALQESRMMLQSKLLEQSQVLISTGLGGKDSKLRYFFAIFTKNTEPFSAYQQKIIKSEFDYIFKHDESEIEEIDFAGYISTIIALVPLHVPVQELFTKAVTECNQYGDFVKESCIITNVKKLTTDEIIAFTNKDTELNINGVDQN